MRKLIFGSLALAAVLSPAAVMAGGSTGGAPVQVQMSDDGPIFVTTSGMTLYTYGNDDATPGKSACSTKVESQFPDPTAGFGKMHIPGYHFAKSCAEVGPPLLADATAQPYADWSLVDRPEGGKQWAFKGRPLYTSVRDKKPGDRNGISMDQFGRRGFRLAKAPHNLPPGVDYARVGDEIILTAKGRAIFTPKGTRLRKACAACNSDFKPVAAPAVVRTDDRWTAIQSAPGQRQYAYAGKPLFNAPEGMTDREVLDTGEWETVAVRKGAGRPTVIGTRYSPLLGDIFTTRDGRTLYIFTCTAPNAIFGAPGCDLPGGPAAYWAAMCGVGKECARRWRPYAAEPGAKPLGEWSIEDVADPVFTDPAGQTYPSDVPRVKAWAYRGRPVYTFHQDVAPGDIWGQQMRWHSLAQFVAVQVPGGEPTQ